MSYIFIAYFNYYRRNEGINSARFGASLALMAIQLFLIGSIFIVVKSIFQTDIKFAVKDNKLSISLCAVTWILINYFYYDHRRISNLQNLFESQTSRKKRRWMFISIALLVFSAGTFSILAILLL